MTAQQLINRNLKIAKDESRIVRLYNLRFLPNGEILHDAMPITAERAEKMITANRAGNAEDAEPKAPTKIKKINTATKLFLKSLALQMEESGQPFLILGTDISILPQDRPRLTNLKKMGYVVTIETKTDGRKFKQLEITDLGQEVLRG